MVLIELPRLKWIIRFWFIAIGRASEVLARTDNNYTKNEPCLKPGCFSKINCVEEIYLTSKGITGMAIVK